MTPTLAGRIQSRIYGVLIIGGLWTLFIALFIGEGLGYLDTLWNAYQVLLWVAGAGLLWELLYHWRQQYRWEKDWPIMYGFFTFINEGILAFFLVHSSFLGLTTYGGVGTGDFLWHFLTTWVVIWVFLNGPQRIFFIRWRFEGGRFV